MAMKILEPFYMLIPPRRIDYYRQVSYNYFEELKREKAFLLSKNGLETKSEIFPKAFEKLIKDTPVNNRFFKSTGTYQIALNGLNAVDIVNEDKIAFVMTMEGANMFNSSDSENSVLQNIREVKSWNDTPVFFVSLAHHFYNQLCGQAHSIPDEGAFFINQSEGLLSGITSKGWAVIRELLSLDDSNQIDISKGRRILVDLKHMKNGLFS